MQNFWQETFQLLMELLNNSKFPNMLNYDWTMWLNDIPFQATPFCKAVQRQLTE